MRTPQRPRPRPCTKGRPRPHHPTAALTLTLTLCLAVPAAQEAFGFGPTQIALFFAICPLFYMVFAFPAGTLCDRKLLPHKQLLGIGCGGLTAAFVCFTSPWSPAAPSIVACVLSNVMLCAAAPHTHTHTPPHPPCPANSRCSALSSALFRLCSPPRGRTNGRSSGLLVGGVCSGAASTLVTVPQMPDLQQEAGQRLPSLGAEDSKRRTNLVAATYTTFQVGHGLQLPSLWRIPAAAVSGHPHHLSERRRLHRAAAREHGH